MAQKPGLDYLDIYSGMKKHPDKSSLLRPADGVHLSLSGHRYAALEELKFFAEKFKF